MMVAWATAAYAAELSFAEGIETVPFKAVVYVFFLSVLGGMAATLPKMLSPAIVIKNLPLEIIKDVVCSFVAGLILFLISIWQEWPWSLTCLLVLLGGAGNAKVIDLALNNGLFPKLGQAFGKGADPVPPPAVQPMREETPQ
jgi:hypothetical protein